MFLSVSSLESGFEMNKKKLFGVFVLSSLSVLLMGMGLSTQRAEACRPCSEPTKIILIRHGQTHWNVLHILQGDADIPLDEIGVEQAECLAQEIAGKDSDFDATASVAILKTYGFLG